MMRMLLALLAFTATLNTPVRAAIQEREVAYQDGDLALRGVLVWDDAVSGPRPGVLVVHEWWGRNDYAKRRATMLAGLGYAAFAVDMYGAGKLTSDPAQAGAWAGALKNDRPAMRARVGAGLKAFQEQKEVVDPANIAAIGYCFGGTTVLELARGGAPVKGVVSFHGALGTPTPSDIAGYKGRILACHGADDPYVPDAEVAGFVKEMRDAKADWQFVHYAGAVHSFTSPAAGNDPSKGAAYHAEADRRSWRDMQGFLKDVLGR